MPTPLKVLVLEDRPADAELVIHQLRRAEFTPEWTQVDTKENYLNALNPSLDIILADYSLPQFDALQALRLLQERDLDIPFILISGTIGEELAVECIKQGAIDYLLKDRLARLGQAVSSALEEKRLRTEKLQAEEALRESQQSLLTLMSNLPGMAYRCHNDKNWTMAFVSEGCAELTGYRPSTLTEDQTITYKDLIHPDDRERTRRAMLAALQKGTPYQFSYRITTANKEEKWVWEQGRGVADVEGVVTTLEGYVTDITENKRMEEWAQQQDRLAAVGQMASGIAHDFNNLLTVVIGTAQLMDIQPDMSEADIRTNLKSIFNQGHRASQLIRQVLDFTRQRETQHDPMDLVPFLKETIKLLDRTIPETVQITTDLGEGSYIVKANLTQLQQVVTNLCVNARDALPDGGELKISLRRRKIEPEEPPPLPEIHPGDWALLTVSDTGTGMPPEIMGHIFDPFYTTKEAGKGTGLGLAQVYGIVKQHDGEIDVESVPGAGTTFTVYLPITTEEEALSKESTFQNLKGNDETILVVEDEPDVLDMTKRILERLNYRVFTANNGKEALEVCDQHQGQIALVLTDVVMPEMGGIELLRVIRERNPSLPVVIMTGYSPQNAEGNPILEQIAGYMEKPLVLEQIAQIIYHALRDTRPDMR